MGKNDENYETLAETCDSLLVRKESKWIIKNSTLFPTCLNRIRQFSYLLTNEIFELFILEMGVSFSAIQSEIGKFPRFPFFMDNLPPLQLLWGFPFDSRLIISWKLVKRSRFSRHSSLFPNRTISTFAHANWTFHPDSLFWKITPSPFSLRGSCCRYDTAQIKQGRLFSGLHKTPMMRFEPHQWGFCYFFLAALGKV